MHLACRTCLWDPGAFSPVYQPRCIIPGASAPVHQPWCISPGASAPVHQPRCISNDASATVQLPRRITPYASPPVHHPRCIASGSSPPVHHLWPPLWTAEHHTVALYPAQLGGLHTLILSCCYTLKISHLLLCPQDSVFNHCTES